MKKAFAYLLPLALIGCGAGPTIPPTALPAVNLPDPVPDPCLDSNCATKTEHLSIFDAENLAFSGEGRLFVSGGADVFEITKDANGDLLSTIVSDEACNYTGLEMVANILYAACGDNRLFAADIDSFPLIPIYTITDSQLANGLAALGGNLYVTDGPITLTSKIIQISLDPSDPTTVLGQSNWTASGELTSANGLQAVNGELWVTDYNELKRFEVGNDGSKGASSTILTQGTAAFDDFTVLDNGEIVMNDFTGNVSLLFSPEGTLLESSNDVLGPSAAIQGQPPLFDRSQIIITEKGTLGDSTQGNGNRLAIFTAD